MPVFLARRTEDTHADSVIHGGYQYEHKHNRNAKSMQK